MLKYITHTYLNKQYTIIEAIKNGDYCTIIMYSDEFDVLTSYEGEYDPEVVNELLAKTNA